MKGIDISNWQAGLNLWNLDIDFIIMKATEGTGFVDAYCDEWMNQAKERGIKRGFYHYAKSDSPYDEARFFVDNCRNYFGDAIPILDIEDNAIGDWGMFADAFCHEVRDLTGVAPMVYCSASQLYRFAGYSLVDFCGLWVAGYPVSASWWVDEPCPYDVSPWPFAAIWQFTSSLILEGYGGNLDGNISYMDGDAWDRYANPNSQPVPIPEQEPITPSGKTIDDVAFEVILGEYGNDEIRKSLLAQNGYDYETVQNRVNEIYDVAQQVINGDYGNGQDRVDRLALAGYNPNVVQHVVNNLLA